MAIRRGTTPTHIFTMPFQIPNGSRIRVVYVQNNNIILECTTERCEIDNNIISYKLTSDETLLFDCDMHYIEGRYQTVPIEIQVGIHTPDDNKMWSNIITTSVEKCLREDGVI